MRLKISETLEFLTQVHTSWDNTEQRAALRKYPRRSISYDYHGMIPAQSQYLRALSYARQNEQIEIPLWHAACSMTEPAYANMSHVSLSSGDLWQFRGCSGVIFWRNDVDGGERYFLSALHGDGSLKLTEILEKNYSIQGHMICPVAYGYLKPEEDFILYTDSLSDMQLNVELLTDYTATGLPTALDENYFEPWENSTPFQHAIPPAYQGVDIFPIPPSWAGDIAGNFTRNANKLDNKSGLVKYDVKSLSSSENKEMEYVLASRSEINNFQRFFTKCKGRWKSFYAPTWLNDMTMTEDAAKGQSYIMVEWPLYWKYYSQMSRRKLIILFLKNGRVQIIPLAGYSTDAAGKYGKVYLDSTLTAAVKKSDVLLISFLLRYRFDNDALIMDYDTAGMATTTISFAEVNA
ncbi:hypothetical protein [Acetonema longum]|uniref:Uncharacterized protein n=1 Tax=Acetonema longum DSM 6540 TaxID=1009370 RepID=F7NEA9_9FIRM|nr:hypothetical protein [Acetonema longum]EGO65621.1 hypothetical protein ALO_01859 [Acetonema longum DSM 6540]